MTVATAAIVVAMVLAGALEQSLFFWIRQRDDRPRARAEGRQREPRLACDRAGAQASPEP